MNYKAFIAFLFIIFLHELTSSQTTSFFKYKDDIDLSVTTNRIKSKKKVTKSFNKVLALSNFTVEHFAKTSTALIWAYRILSN
ncbi:MAG: hypothetical protein ABR980_13020 [Ignavibacteriaceae bacterium]|jgi:hypothetical protein